MDLNLGSTKALIDECRKQGLLRNQAAYVLATSWHETAHTMKPIYERGKRSYFDKYEPGTTLGKRLGNVNKGDGFKYRGAGYCQLTGLDNFIRASKKTGVDLVNNPSKALDPLIAAKIIVIGMVEGWFTTKKLSDYLTASKTDFVEARRIINGKDKAALIANYARDYDMDLQVYGYAQKKPAAKPQKPAGPLKNVEAPSPIVTPAVVQVAAPVAATIDKATIQTAQKRLIELGYNPGGADGLLGPLTKGAILSFRNDAGLIVKDEIDDEFLAALATAKPREMVSARANATQSQVASMVPEAKVHWWNRIGATVVGGGAAAGGAVDYIAPATGYLQPVKDFLGDIPPMVWIIGIVAVAAALYFASQYGANKATQAYREGDRR